MVKFFSARPWNYRLMHPITNPFIIFFRVNSARLISRRGEKKFPFILSAQVYPLEVFIFLVLPVNGSMLLKCHGAKERERTKCLLFYLMLNRWRKTNRILFITLDEMNLLTDPWWVNWHCFLIEQRCSDFSLCFLNCRAIFFVCSARLLSTELQDTD